MFTKTLLPDTVRAIKLISDIPIIKKAYLAGGTALALHLGHRVSIDLDFFTQEELEEKILSANLHGLSEFKEDGVAWRTVWGKIGETKFSLFYYKYPLLAQTHPFMGIHLLDVKDIAAMKVAALGDRGTKRKVKEFFHDILQRRMTYQFQFISAVNCGVFLKSVIKSRCGWQKLIISCD